MLERTTEYLLNQSVTYITPEQATRLATEMSAFLIEYNADQATQIPGQVPFEPPKQAADDYPVVALRLRKMLNRAKKAVANAEQSRLDFLKRYNPTQGNTYRNPNSPLHLFSGMTQSTFEKSLLLIEVGKMMQEIDMLRAQLKARLR